MRVGSGEVRQDVAHLRFSKVGDREDALAAHPLFGEGPGLVGADHVDAGEPLDGGKLLHQHLLAAEPDHPERECHGRDEHQPLGHHRDQGPGHTQDGLVPGDSRQRELDDDRRQPDRDQKPGDEPQDLVDAALEFGVDQGELGRLGRQLGRIRIGADLGGPIEPGPGDREAAGHDGVTDLLRLRVGLSREQAFVDLEMVGADDLAVDDQLVTGGQFDEVVEDHVVSGKPQDAVGSMDQRLGLAHDCERIERVFRAELLDDPDGRVGDDQQPEGRIDPGSRGQDDDQQDGQDGVDAGEDVVSDDLPDRPTATGRECVDLASRDPFGHVCRGQSLGSDVLHAGKNARPLPALWGTPTPHP
jgi:hypothetical protein